VKEFKDFKKVYSIDFEFYLDDNYLQVPVCMVAKEFKSGEEIRIWKDELNRLSECPIIFDEKTLMVSFFATAELNCFKTLGWKFPVHLLDTYLEFKCLVNGFIQRISLLNVLNYLGLDSIESSEKNELRDLILSRGPWSERNKLDILDYCASDVTALNKILAKIIERINLPQALFRGETQKSSSEIECKGIPVNKKQFEELKKDWGLIKETLIREVDKDYGVYENETFKISNFKTYIKREGIAWPKTDKGNLKTDKDTFKQLSKCHKKLEALGQLRASLGGMRLFESLQVGEDSRARCMLSPFSAKTSRYQPSTSRYLFGCSAWVRSLITPHQGMAIAYIDWSQQEFGIGAALSKDEEMMNAYLSSDPYLEFAKQAGKAPPNATKKTHKEIRSRFKECVLATQYGMGAASLAMRIGCSELEAMDLLNLHRRTYSTFWNWSDSVMDCAMITSSIDTIFGWRLNVNWLTKEKTIRNFPMQANGAEMLRLACIYMMEKNIQVCAPVHDAVLIEAPIKDIDEIVLQAKNCMARASGDILSGFELKSDVEIFNHPSHYQDERGTEMWSKVWQIIKKENLSTSEDLDVH